MQENNNVSNGEFLRKCEKKKYLYLESENNICNIWDTMNQNAWGMKHIVRSEGKEDIVVHRLDYLIVLYKWIAGQ